MPLNCAWGCNQLIHQPLATPRHSVNNFGRPGTKSPVFQALFIHTLVNKSSGLVNKLCISIRCWNEEKCYDDTSSLKERCRWW